MDTYDWNNYMYELYQLNQKQESRLKELEEKISQLENKIQEKNKNTIEKIEYHFEQLRIDKLDGTLHIGLSPSDLTNMDEWDLPAGKVNPCPPPANQGLITGLSNYLYDAGPQMIRNLSAEYQIPIDEAYQSVLLEDIAKQLPERVAFYERQSNTNGMIPSSQERTSYIMEQIKNEINHSLTKYMQAYEQKGETK